MGRLTELLPKLYEEQPNAISKMVMKLYDRGMARDWDMSAIDELIDKYIPSEIAAEIKGGLGHQIKAMPPELASAMWKEIKVLADELEEADIVDEIEVGDGVKFDGQDEIMYVVDLDASGRDSYFWVTDQEKNRFDPHAQGWSILKSLASEIVDPASDHDPSDYEEDDEEEDDADEAKTPQIPAMKGMSPLGVKTHKEYDDEETEEIVSLMKGQFDVLKALNASMQKAWEDAKAYNKWLEKNDVQALLSDQNNRLAEEIKKKLQEIQEIV